MIVGGIGRGESAIRLAPRRNPNSCTGRALLCTAPTTPVPWVDRHRAWSAPHSFGAPGIGLVCGRPRCAGRRAFPWRIVANPVHSVRPPIRESERRDGRLACSQGVSTVHHPNGGLDTRHDVPSCRHGRPEAGDDSDRRGRSDHPWHEPVHDEPARSSHRPSSGGDPGRSSSGPRNLCARDPPPDRRPVPPRRCRRGCPQRVSSIVGAVPSSCVFAVRRASLTPEGS